MVAPTLNYAYEMNKAFPGMLADLQNKQATSHVQGEASAEIPFGAGIIAGVASTVIGTPDPCLLPVDVNSRLIGVALHSHAYQSDIQLGTVGMKPKVMVSNLRKGRVYVLWEGGAVARGANIYCRAVAGVGEQKGAFRQDADGSDAFLCRGFK